MSIQSIEAGGFIQTRPTTDPSSRANGPRTQQEVKIQSGTQAASDLPPSAASATAETEKSDDKQQVSPDVVKQAIDKLNEFVSATNAQVVFSIDDDTNQQVVKVVERDTDKVIRQLPSPEAVQIAKVLDKLQGLLVQEKA